MGVPITGWLYSGDTLLAYGTRSVKEYATNKINSSASPVEFKTLLVDMLHYGAAAQLHYGYLTDNLVNADLTEEQLALGTQTTPEYTDKTSLTEGADDSVKINKVALNIDNTVGLLFSFTLGKHNAEDIQIVFEYRNSDDTDDVVKKYTIAESAEKIGDNYVIKFDSFVASSVRKLVKVTFIDTTTGETVGDSMSTSLESRIAQIMETSDNQLEKDLCIALLKFGDSVSAYMESLEPAE